MEDKGCVPDWQTGKNETTYEEGGWNQLHWESVQRRLEEAAKPLLGLWQRKNFVTLIQAVFTLLNYTQ